MPAGPQDQKFYTELNQMAHQGDEKYVAPLLQFWDLSDGLSASRLQFVGLSDDPGTKNGLV